MDSEQVYRQNYAALLDLPIVKELLRKNKKLRKENKSLKNLIYSLPEFRCICSNVEPSRESTTRTIRIKREPVASEPTECETLTENDDVVFIDKNKQNIVYVINEADDSGIDDEVDLDEEEQDEDEEEQDEVEEEQEEVEEEQEEVEEEEQDEVEEEQEQDEVEEEEEEQDEVEEEQDEVEEEQEEQEQEEQEEE